MKSLDSHTIRDPLAKDIRLSEPLYRLYRSPFVQKLSRIKQLGPVFHLYPGAVHTRLNHSLGVYHLGVRIIENLRSRSESQIFTQEGVAAFLSACLLHDIGHFPYAHSLKDVVGASHEALAARMIEDEVELSRCIAETGCSAHLVGAIIDEEIETEEQEILLYRSILSGTLDPDKLDYLTRDAYFCGVPYGVQDVEYILGNLRVAHGRLALAQEAISSVEHLLFSKYLMYKNVYWHHTTRSLTAMIKKAVCLALADHRIHEEDLYHHDDDSFVSLMSGDALVAQVQRNRPYPTRYQRQWEPGGALEQKVAAWGDRLALEAQIATSLGVPQDQVIIDLPEPITFESDVTIITSDGRIRTIDSDEQVFSSDVSSLFTKSLRTLRVFTPVEVSEDRLHELLER